MSEKTLPAVNLDDHSTQLLSGGELSVENTNVVQSRTGHANINALADYTTFGAENFDKYLRFPTILFEGTINSNATAGALLYSTEVSPSVMRATKITRIANIASNFLQWNGDLVVRIIFTKAIFMQTKIIAAFIPTGTMADVDKFGVVDMYGAQYHAVMNPDNDNELSFVIPFISGKNWHNMTESTGLFAVRLFQPLIASQTQSGTANTNIPFTITISSTTNSPNRPLCFRYLIAPTTSNSVINEIVKGDFAKQISPQMETDVSSYEQPEALVPADTQPYKKIKTAVILPAKLNVYTNDVLSRRIIIGVNAAQAVYGYGSQFPSIVAGADLGNFEVQPPYANRTYVNYQGGQLNQVTNAFIPLTFDVWGLINCGMQQLAANNITGSNSTFTFQQFTTFCNGYQKVGTFYSFGYSGSSSKQFSLGICSPYMVLDPDQLASMAVLPTCTRVTIGTFTEPVYLSSVICNTATLPYNSYYLYYFTGSMASTQTPANNVGINKTCDFAFSFVAPSIAGNTILQQNTQTRMAAIDEENRTHILAYSCCPPDVLEKALAAGNYTNLFFESQAMLTAAAGRRAVSQVDTNERNFLQFYFAVRKGIKVIANATAYLDTLFTFIDSFLPPGVDPNTYNFKTDNNMYIIPMNDNVPLVFDADLANQPLARYIDLTIKTVPMPITYPTPSATLAQPLVRTSLIPADALADRDEMIDQLKTKLLQYQLE